MMSSLRWRGEGKERGVLKKEGEKFNEVKERKKTTPAGGGRREENTSSEKKSAIGGTEGPGCSQSEASAVGGEDARVSHRQQGHPRQQAMWFLLIVLGEALCFYA